MKKIIIYMLITLLTSSATFAITEKEYLENSLKSLAKLLNNSSVSKQVLHSNNDAAIQYYKFSKSLYNDAVSMYEENKYEKSLTLIKQSKSALFDSIEFSNLKDTAKKTGKYKYESLRKSATSLMNALENISQDETKIKKSKTIINNATQLVGKADKYYFDEQYKKGIEILNDALNLIKPAIRDIRTGNTLVRSLRFAHIKDEYKYELDRNDTHFMLLKMFLKDKAIDNNQEDKILSTIKIAKSLRNDALKYAKKDMYKEAVKKLEKSTLKTIQILRNTGINIPGYK